MPNKAQAALILFAIVLAAPSLVSAAGQKKAVVTGVDIVAFMPDKDGWRREFAVAMESKLKQAGFAIQKAPSGCKDISCLEKAVVQQGADVAVNAKILPDGQRPPGYEISVSIFDRTSAEPLRTREVNCPNCAELETKQRLGALVGELIGEPSTPSVTSPIESPQMPLSVTRNTSYKSRTKPLWLTLGSVGAAGFVGSMVALGVYASVHHQPDCDASLPVDRSCAFRKDATTGIAVSAALGAISAAAAITGFVLYAREKKKETVSFAPILNPSIVGLVMEGKF